MQGSTEETGDRHQVCKARVQAARAASTTPTECGIKIEALTVQSKQAAATGKGGQTA